MLPQSVQEERQAKQIIRRLAKLHKVRVVFVKDSSSSHHGWATISKNVFTINTAIPFSDDNWIKAALHELGHFFAIRHGIYKYYHRVPSDIFESTASVIELISAEWFADAWAAQRYETMYPGKQFRYYSLISVPEAVKALKYRADVLNLKIDEAKLEKIALTIFVRRSVSKMGPLERAYHYLM